MVFFISSSRQQEPIFSWEIVGLKILTGSNLHFTRPAICKQEWGRKVKFYPICHSEDCHVNFNLLRVVNNREHQATHSNFPETHFQLLSLLMLTVLKHECFIRFASPLLGFLFSFVRIRFVFTFLFYVILAGKGPRVAETYPFLIWEQKLFCKYRFLVRCRGKIRLRLRH